jgi:hypothetical protein
MRSVIIVAAAACVMAPATAFLTPPPTAGLVCKTELRVSLRAPLLASSRSKRMLALRMSADAAEATKVKKLAEDAAKALEEARLAEEKASAMRRSRGEQSRTLNRESDIRAKMLLGSVGDVLYKTWNSVLAGRPQDEAHDFLGLNQGAELSKVSDEERRKRVKALFDAIDTDGSGMIDEAELAAGIKQVLDFDASEEELAALMREVDADGDGRITLLELTTVCLNIMNKAEAQAMAAAQTAAKEAAIQARTRTFDSVMTALNEAGALSVEDFPQVALVGNASVAVKVLDSLKQDGKIALWDSAPRFFQATGADRMKAVTGMASPERDLGLEVDSFTRFRYQGISFLGLTGGLALLVAGVPGPWWNIGLTPDVLANYGGFTLLVNLCFTLFAPQLEKFNMARLLTAEGDAEDRWWRKQV